LKLAVLTLHFVKYDFQLWQSADSINTPCDKHSVYSHGCQKRMQ